MDGLSCQVPNLSGGSVSPSVPMLLATDEECDRLRMAMVVSQDAAVVHSLLEFCLPTEEEKVRFLTTQFR
ncbi:unnamed protein product [Protopolystoma xenopodis]|uniref:Uncharacterized protein n=1 Tax=Protopolystoma xenopodis TaxID=117903 RepID=A0A3S5AD24_9PLAT|nr:unnamed protein product [Protopolystoma xenopodis]